MEVSITANGKRGSGKSTLLRIASNAFRAAGYEVSAIQSFGEEVIRETIIVTTAREEIKTVWLNKK